MAPIGFAIALIPEKIWEPLSEVAKQNVQDWLLQINDCVCANNNWHLFRVSSPFSPVIRTLDRMLRLVDFTGACEPWSSSRWRPLLA